MRRLRTTTLADASRFAERADVRSLELLRERVREHDVKLGGRRHDDIAGLSVDARAHLDAAHRLRLAQDQWLLAADRLRDYRRAISPYVAGACSRQQDEFEDIKLLAGPAPQRVVSARARAEPLCSLRRVDSAAAAQLLAIHAAFRSAFALAGTAVQLRRDAVEATDLELARRASSAAAGAMLLLERGPRRLEGRARAAREDSPPGRDHAAPHHASPRRRPRRVPHPLTDWIGATRRSSAPEIPASWCRRVRRPSSCAARSRSSTLAGSRTRWPGRCCSHAATCTTISPSRLAVRPRQLSAFEREVMLNAVVSRRGDATGCSLPTNCGRASSPRCWRCTITSTGVGRSVDDFERNFRNELEREQETDRGAARLLQQTVFLTAAYRAYQGRLIAAATAATSIRLRDALHRRSRSAPAEAASIVTVAGPPGGSRRLVAGRFRSAGRAFPRSSRSICYARRACLAAGLSGTALCHVSRHRGGALRGVRLAGRRSLVAPGIASRRRRRRRLLHVSRSRRGADRRRAPVETATRATGLRRRSTRTALIVRRPLPYLYLARDVFADAAFRSRRSTRCRSRRSRTRPRSIWCSTRSLRTSRARRCWPCCDRRISASANVGGRGCSVAACDVALAEARYLGGLDRLQALVDAWAADTARHPAKRAGARRRCPALQTICCRCRHCARWRRDRPHGRSHRRR